jgi:hypothetical protein
MPKHIKTNSFEAFKTSRKSLEISLQNLLNQYGLAKKIFAYVKNEGASLYTMIIALKS